ncbi:methyltransferase domain-containing protein [Bacillus salacetis]|uniref:Methyltransferase domain-containing protein n=1 Tax=Bacillus salacetis TaxID=2315464 RepID=A0A3A1QV76_9BACI|nr:methyltransferase domain-containing protein [Bacillus salacetis]RIW31881.1 methyltransferase domain-containing protein [Bacillus salacetis]
MKKPIDRIYEAYFNELGKEFGEKVRVRIHWLLENAKGEEILDIGCSQGLLPILLGREGKNVLGLDLMEEAISYAKDALEKESPDTKKHVIFETSNFMDYDFEGKTYDSVVMGEILEHIADPMRFINKASELLNDTGQLIVTVPFGVNDYFDHKKTYYLKDLLDFSGDNMKITDIKFFGKWVGVVYKKEGQSNNESFIKLDSELLLQFESTLASNERTYIKQIIDLKKKTAELNKTIEEIQLEEKTEDRVNSNVDVQYKEEVEKLKAEIEHEKKEKVIMKRKLVEAYQKEEELLKEYKVSLKRYNSLKNSKLGKITSKYWKLRKSLSRGN